MKQNLYLMRHAQTLFNQLHRIQGFCDSPLTEQGIKDAKKVGEYFKKSNIVFDHAYSSTQERASDTLELVTDHPYERLKGLKEWNFGVFEGESEALNPPHKPGQHSYEDFFVQFGGESNLQVRRRMAETLVKVMNRKNHENVLVVSHGGAISQFLQQWISWEELRKKVKFYNCCVIKLKFENNFFTLEEVIDAINM
jgi:broad specificity phosphatase PhoE